MMYVVPSVLALYLLLTSAFAHYLYLQVALRIDYLSMCMLVATRTHEYL